MKRTGLFFLLVIVSVFQLATLPLSAQSSVNTPITSSNAVVEQAVTNQFQDLKQKAEHGDALAQGKLGECYYRGQNIQQDFAKAVWWFQKGAEQGNAGAQSGLGVCYYNGQGVEKDYSEAVKWVRKAATQGESIAQNNLGTCYSRGRGVTQDFIEAYKYFTLAAAQGNELAIKNRDALSAKMTREQIAEAQRRASPVVVQPAISNSIPSQPKVPLVSTRTGTGFLIASGKNTFLLTACHVVKNATNITVVSSGKSFPAQIVNSDPANDLAVLRVAVSPADLADGTFPQQALPISLSSHVQLGDSVFTIGFPNPLVQGIAKKLTRGEINSLAGIQDDPRYFQTSVSTQPGNSGGALVDKRGNVIGVMVMRLNDLKTWQLTGSFPQNVNYAIKGSFVTAFLESIAETVVLPVAHTENNRKFETVAKEVEQATVLIVAH